MGNKLSGTKRNRCGDVPAHQLTPHEIKLKSIRFLDKSNVPCDAVVFKQGRGHYAMHNGEKTQVFLPDSLVQKRYQYYNGKDIPETYPVFGGGTKHHKSYIIEDGKKIAVFLRGNLSQFHLAFNDGQLIEPQTTVYLDESNKLYIEVDGQKMFVTQVRKNPSNRRALSEKEYQYQYYNHKNITGNSKVFGRGRYHKSYIVEDDKKIAVFSKTSLRTFHLVFNDGQFIDPQSTVYLDESNKLYIEDDGQKQFVTQERKKPCSRKKMSSVQESGITTPGGSLESQSMSLGTLGMFAPNPWSSQAPNGSSMESTIPVSSEEVFLDDFDFETSNW